MNQICSLFNRPDSTDFFQLELPAGLVRDQVPSGAFLRGGMDPECRRRDIHRDESGPHLRPDPFLRICGRGSSDTAS